MSLRKNAPAVPAVTPQSIKEFAEKYRVRTKRDSCGEDIITGKRVPKDMPKRVEYACHVYDHGDGRFGLLLLLKTKRAWNNAKKELTAAGFTIKQNGDTEGTALFNPEDQTQAGLAFKLARIRARREMTPEARAAASERLRLARLTPVKQGVSSARNDERPADGPVWATGRKLGEQAAA